MKDFIYNEKYITGTKNVLWACKKMNVKALVYSSTLATIMMNDQIIDNTESSTPQPRQKDLVFGEYGWTRVEAEEIILNANNTINCDGKYLSVSDYFNFDLFKKHR